MSLKCFQRALCQRAKVLRRLVGVHIAELHQAGLDCRNDFTIISRRHLAGKRDRLRRIGGRPLHVCRKRRVNGRVRNSVLLGGIPGQRGI
ncbi:hypothetical protein SDC9_99882 [bioreactor metagenome]|uniref:Uncharacterized protein n=1 Tax=bioreactor metagenome TaxID=1076179 RepID=A0A645AK58_9ZZZZ